MRVAVPDVHYLLQGEQRVARADLPQLRERVWCVEQVGHTHPVQGANRNGARGFQVEVDQADAPTRRGEHASDRAAANRAVPTQHQRNLAGCGSHLYPLRCEVHDGPLPNDRR